MQRSDAICEYHRGDIYGTASNLNLLLSVMTTGLAGSSAVLADVLTKSALAAAAAFTSATQSHINVNSQSYQVLTHNSIDTFS